MQYFLHGLADISAGQAVSADTLFEIGSVTKPLLALAALELVQNGVWQLDKPINQQTENTAFANHSYTLADLITHQSGLPRLPDNLTAEPTLANKFDVKNPYAEYNKSLLLSAAANQRLDTRTFRYSNYGYGLLGYLLAEAQNQSLDQIMRQQVFLPLGMNTAVLQRSGSVYSNLAKGYAIDGQQVSNWQFDALAGAGATLASITDMAMLLKKLLSSSDNNSVIRQWLQPINLDGAMQMTAGWMQQDGVLWHAGQTGGFCSVVAFNLSNQTGIVILTNLARPVTTEGFELLKQLQAMPVKEQYSE